jgi:hypothetical protein
MRSFFHVTLPISVALAAPAIANENTCRGGNLSFDIRTSATWRIAPGEQFQLIADLSEPALYEVCRDGALNPRWIEISTDSGVNSGLALENYSCVLVYSARIGIYSGETIGHSDSLSGTFRRIHDINEPTFSDVTNFRIQASFVDSIENNFQISAVTGGPTDSRETLNMVYRLCQENSATRPIDQSPGMTLHVGGMPLTRFPIDHNSAIFGVGSCVDFQGGDVFARVTQENNEQVTFLGCGQVAWRKIATQ